MTVNIFRCGMVGLVSLLLMSSCKSALDLKPKIDLDAGTALTGYDNLQSAVDGAYSLANSSSVMGSYLNLVELSSDNVEVLKAGNNATTAGIECYSFEHTASMQDLKVWGAGYKAIYHANMVINAIPDNSAANLLQLKGECLFLRAWLHMQLVQAFGRPYVQDNGGNPGVPYVVSTDPSLLPARNTVKEVYDKAVADFTAAAEMLTQPKSNAYASKEACWAALADLYLNENDGTKALEFANEVINAGKFSLVNGNGYINYFNNDHSSAADKETIFTLKSIDGQSKGFYGLGYSYTQTKYAAVSAGLMTLLKETPGDLRLSFYTSLPTTTSGDRYFVNKFVQQDDPSVSSPVIFRLADMYLIRAEVNAKTTALQAALDDVNLLRTRAGITDAGLYKLNNLHGRANVLAVVLDEARVEFAFENGRRRMALLRNNQATVRDYAGSTVPGSHINIPATDKAVIYPLPATEITVNPNLEQNPF